MRRRPGTAEAQLGEKLPWWKLKVRKTQWSRSDKKPSLLETGTAKTNSAKISCGSLSDSRRPLVKIRGHHSYGWKAISSVQSQGHVPCFVTPRTAAWQPSLSIRNSQSLLTLMCIESVLPSNCLILCSPLLLLQSFPTSGSFPMS